MVGLDCGVEISFRAGSMVELTDREYYRRVHAMDWNHCVPDVYRVSRFGLV